MVHKLCFSSFQSGGTADYVILKQKLALMPDRFMMDGRTHRNGSQTAINPSTDIHGAWEYVAADKQIKYLGEYMYLKMTASIPCYWYFFLQIDFCFS